MKVLHVVPGLAGKGNGIAVAAKLIVEGQRREGHDADLTDAASFPTSASDLNRLDEVWVHSMWLPATMRACWKVLKFRQALERRGNDVHLSLVRMTHANLDPVRYRHHGWKKRFAAPVERWLFRRADRVVATCEAEAEWNRAWLGPDACRQTKIEVIDLKRFFRLQPLPRNPQHTTPLHVLYLGRRHPLKGVQYLERAVATINASRSSSAELRIVSHHFGEELERDWEWCDVLCLPTLSENFGLVVAEALERGKRVITTDGAPAWENQPDVLYLCGYRNGSGEVRVRLLLDALKGILNKGGTSNDEGTLP